MHVIYHNACNTEVDIVIIVVTTCTKNNALDSLRTVWELRHFITM